MIDTHSETDRPVRGAEVPSAAAVPRRRRPFGVNVIIVLLMLDFAASAIAGVVVVLGWSMISAEVRLETATSTVYSVVTGLASLVVAMRLFRLKRRAWYGVMILTGISLLVAIWQYFRGAQPYVELLQNALIVFYLNQREVQSLFVAANTKEPPQ